MDTTTLFGKLSAGIPVSEGVGTLSDAPGTGFEQTSVFTELFDGVLN
jgi:hypothetical protein